MNKLNFLKTEFPKLVSALSADTKGEWGVLNAQQMVEHMADSISFGTGNNNQKLHSPIESIGRFRDFAMSEKEFKPNTPNALMSATPLPAIYSTVKESIVEYEKQIEAFIHYFESNKEATITNPFFGDLNFDEWTHLLYKHAVHHANQFGLL